MYFWLLGPALVALSGLGFFIDYRRLPAPPGHYGWLIYAIVALSLVGISFYRSRRQTVWFLVALVIAGSWWIARGIYQPAMSLASRMAQNPYMHTTPGGSLRGLFMVTALAGLVMAFVAWRVVDSVAENSVGPAPRLSLFRGFKRGKMDIAVCKDIKTKRPVIIPGHDRYLHSVIIGPTGCGKTSRILMPMVHQDLRRIARGEKIGITVVEPKGSFVAAVADLCSEMGIPYILVDPMRKDSAHFNPMEGNGEDVAEATRTVLRSIFGKQEAFFANVQELAAKMVIRLLKDLKGDDMDMVDVVRALRDPNILSAYVTELERKQGRSEVTETCRQELLGSQKDKYLQFAIGVRTQLEDISSHSLLNRILTGKSDVHMDDLLQNGGVLLINTAMNLQRLGDMFGKFTIMHLQAAVFRRPGNERNRTPHFLYIDEISRYVNPNLEHLLAIGREYRCATTMALQALSQLELEEKSSFTDIVLTNCRHKIVFGGINSDDAKRFEREFGEVQQLKRTPSYDHRLLVPAILPESFRTEKKFEPRFRYTDIMELSKFQMIYRVVQNGTYLPPGIGQGELVKELNNYNLADPQVVSEPEPAAPQPVLFREETPQGESVPPAPSEPLSGQEAAVGAGDDGFWG